MRTSQEKFTYTVQSIKTMRLDVESILERLKEVYGLASDADLARFLDMTSSGVSTWKRRGSLDLSAIVEKCLATPTADLKMVNLHWLIAGNGAASLQTVQSIIIDEITSRTPEVMREIVSSVIDKLKMEGFIPGMFVASAHGSTAKQRRREDK